MTSLRLRAPTGFPDAMFVNLHYEETINYIAGTFDQFVWSGNNLADVNVTGGGHQPLYFDQYTSLYNRWTVSSSSISATIINNSSTASSFMVVPTANEVGFLNMTEAQEQPYSKSVLLSSQFGDNRATIRHTMTTKKARGETVLDDTFSGQAVSVAPNRLWFWQTAAAIHGAGTVNTWVRFKLTYRVRFFKRIPPGQS